MKRKIIWFSGFVVIALAFGVAIFSQHGKGWSVNPSIAGRNVPLTQSTYDDSNIDNLKIRDTLNKAIRLDIEAAYSLDATQLATVYINDSRGGELAPAALVYIQKVRQDYNIKEGQVGFLDYHQAVVEWRKQEYNRIVAELREKQANGKISEDEKIMLEKEINRGQTPQPESIKPTFTPTQPCTNNPSAASDVSKAYPGYNPTALPTATPGKPLPFCGPTPTPTPFIQVSSVGGRGDDPATLPPIAFELTIKSISVNGDIASAVVSKSEAEAEMILVKVNEHWYIAGAKSVTHAPSK